MEYVTKVRRALPWFHKSYFYDWGLLLAISVATILVNLLVAPHHREIVANDASVTYPLLASIVSGPLLAVIVIAVPLAVLCLAQIIIRSSHDLHNALLTFLSGFMITLLFTAAAKLYCGRPRPDHIAMTNQFGQGYRDSWESFPSGHSSSSFAAMVFLALYWHGKAGTFRRYGGQLWKLVVSMIPISVAGWAACSRTRDYHHFYADIVAGSIIGTGIMTVCYFLMYPPLWDTDCHLPKLRVEQDPVPPHVAVEEERTPLNSALNV